MCEQNLDLVLVVKWNKGELWCYERFWSNTTGVGGYKVKSNRVLKHLPISPSMLAKYKALPYKGPCILYASKSWPDPPKRRMEGLVKTYTRKTLKRILKDRLKNGCPCQPVLDYTRTVVPEEPEIIEIPDDDFCITID